MNNEIKQILKNQLTIISTMSTMNPEEICKKNLENSFNETQELLNPKNQKEIGEKTNESMGGRYGEEPTMNPDKKSKGCGKVTYSHGIPMPKCGTYPKGKNFIYLCEECCTKDDALKGGTCLMKKPIKMPLPKCNKCKKTLEPQFTTEKEDGYNSKPEILMMYGKCDDCKIITMCNLIKTKDIPTMKDYDDLCVENEQ